MRMKSRMFTITLACGCRIRASMRPHRKQSSYVCRSNQGHVYSQPWASYQWPDGGAVVENPLLNEKS